jgi:anti-anti-sigma factor
MTGITPALTIDAQPGEHELVVRVGGELDLTNCAQLLDAVRAEAGPDVTRIVLDVPDLTFCDSAGLGALVRLHKDLLGAGGGLTVRSPTAPVRRLLEITGLSTVFTVQPAHA